MAEAMTGYVTKKKFEDVASRLAQRDKRIANIKKEGLKITKIGLRTVGVGGSAALIGYFKGRSKDDPTKAEMFGLPVELVVALVGTGLNVMGYAGDEQTSDLVQAVADGGIAVYAYDKGKTMGEDAKAA